MATDRFSSSDARSFRTPAGTIKYTDVGTGPPVVFLHGNPTSAHLYRHLINELAPDHRCIAPDYLGFGRSDAPTDFSYRPPAHATLVESLLHSLEVHNVTLVLHDWGGPIGMSYALRHSDRIRALVLMNTWAWPLSPRSLIHMASRLLGTPLGQGSVERLNAFARLIMPATTGRSETVSPEWISAYAEALNTRPRRHACWVFARALYAESTWLRALWTQRDRLHTHPALLCWGMADPAFGSEECLKQWHALFLNADIQRYPNVGHYVPEEMGTDLVSPVQSFLQSLS